jgi:hypothetical protein
MTERASFGEIKKIKKKISKSRTTFDGNINKNANFAILQKTKKKISLLIIVN